MEHKNRAEKEPSAVFTTLLQALITPSPLSPLFSLARDGPFFLMEGRRIKKVHGELWGKNELVLSTIIVIFDVQKNS